jgi:hypothetical protein
MGYYATTSSSNDDAPLEDKSLPPDASTPRGELSGRVTDVQTGTGVADVIVSIGGMTDGPDALAGKTGPDGRYTIAGVPEHTYANVLVQGPGYDHVVLHDVDVAGDTTLDASVRRDWAARDGGATASTTGNEFADYGCGANAAIDQRLESTWSTEKAAPKPLVVTLPQSVDMTGFAIDPSAGCGDDTSASTARYTVEVATLPDGPWTSVADRTDTFGAGLVNVAAAANDVRYVRLTPITNRGGQFIDVSEVAVYGNARGGLPDTTITGGPSGPTRSRDAAFTFSGGSSYECSWDNEPFAACATGVSRHFGADGPHTFAVQAINGNGTDPTPATRSWTIDTVAPGVQLEGGAAGGEATFTFSTSGATSLSCSFDGAAVACDSPARFSDLDEGTHSFTLTARDAAGNVAARTASVDIDLTAPETVFTFAPPPFLTVRDFDLGFAANEPATFVCAVDGGTPAACTSPLALRNLADGAHTVTVTATDAYGNVASPASSAFTVAVPQPLPQPTVTPTPTVTPKPAALVSVSVAKRMSRKARRLQLTVRAARGARVTVSGKLGRRTLGKLAKTSRGTAMKLRLSLNARRLRKARKGSTLTVRVTASGTGLVPGKRTFKVKLKV